MTDDELSAAIHKAVAATGASDVDVKAWRDDDGARYARATGTLHGTEWNACYCNMVTLKRFVNFVPAPVDQWPAMIADGFSAKA